MVDYRRKTYSPTSIGDRRGNPPRNACWVELFVGKRQSGNGEEVTLGCPERSVMVFCCCRTPRMTHGFTLNLSLPRVHLTLISPMYCWEVRVCSSSISLRTLVLSPLNQHRGTLGYRGSVVPFIFQAPMTTYSIDL